MRMIMIIFSETKRVYYKLTYKITLRNISEGDCPGGPVIASVPYTGAPVFIPHQETGSIPHDATKSLPATAKRSHMPQLRLVAVK